MIFFDILSSWKDTIYFLKSENFKLIILVSIKAVYSAFRPILSILGLMFFVSVLGSLIFPPNSAAFYNVILISSVCGYFLFILSLRPSLEAKTFSYFFDYLLKLIPITLLLIVVYSISVLAVGIASNLSLFIFCFNILSLLKAFTLVQIFAFQFMILTFLFALDSKFRLQDCFLSVFKSIKALIWYTPFFVLMCILNFVLDLIILKGTYFFNFLAPIITYILSFIFFIIFIAMKLFMFSLITNFYVRIKHTNFSLFYF